MITNLQLDCGGGGYSFYSPCTKSYRVSSNHRLYHLYKPKNFNQTNFEGVRQLTKEIFVPLMCSWLVEGGGDILE